MTESTGPAKVRVSDLLEQARELRGVVQDISLVWENLLQVGGRPDKDARAAPEGPDALETLSLILRDVKEMILVLQEQIGTRV